MQITQKYLPIPSNRRSGEKILDIKYIVCHDTGNDGSTALGNVNYYIQSASAEQASAHTFVDDQGAIECIPLTEKAWHVRYNAGIAPNIDGSFANDHAIGVELCFSTYGIFDSKKAYENYCEYIGGLLIQYGLDTTKLVQHAQLDPSRRTDPFNAFSKIGKTWDMFLKDVQSIISSKQIHTMKEDTEVATGTVASAEVAGGAVSTGDMVKNSIGQMVPEAENVNVTTATSQTLIVRKVIAYYDHLIEGKEANSYQIEIPVTDDMLVAVKATCLPEYNITVTK